MDSLRQWALNICMVCVASGLLDHLSGGQSKKPVIKFILTLYILVTAFAPLDGLRAPAAVFSASSSVQAMEAPDTEELALAQAQQSLSEDLSRRLGTPISVTLAQNGQEVYAQSAVLVAEDRGSAAELEQALRRELGEQIEITVAESGGHSNEGT